MKRKNYILGNWKLNKTFNEIKTFFEAFNKSLKENKKLASAKSIVFGFAPTAIGLSLANSLKLGNTLIMAQDVCELGNGSYTGQISCDQLKDVGVNTVIIGHSECRKYLGCNDKIVNAKTKALLAANMVPVICIGESIDQYNAGKTKEVLANQIKTIFNGVNAKDAAKCIIAYEPLWAIGTGKIPTLDEINSLCIYMRSVIASIYDKKIADTLPLLYGGSVNEKNALSIISLSDVDGCLIGGVSLHHDKFYQILKDVLVWQTKK